MASVMVLSEQIAPFAHVLIELPLRSAIAAFLLLLPVRALRISPELNLWSEEMIKRARRLFKPEHNKKP